ncbi:glycosyltransferase [Caldovatus aquaticus]|uniref:Glycosyltransferase family 2 protein n=1 Tax=Caldovatus aquaticus TaxID=2865671 RepID=A0ABS7F4W0_9PROT|nr:glycosyltransferase family 2 protein [Caldovatus aquaticus]MBW8270665.1 glycosyltransferase family 2 protein [Caldovatus aquaticus]
MRLPDAAPASATAPPRLPPRLSVIVPCYQEAANVARMVERLAAALAGVAWEVIFVDDDSPDGTAAIAKEIAARDPRVRCIRRVGRRGLASACVEGMLSSAAPYVAVMDGDGQHDEALLPRMLEALEQGRAEVVVGSRHVAGGDAAEGLSPLRRAVSRAGAALARALLPVRVADPMSGFFMLPRPLAEELAPRLSATGFKILLDLLLSAPRPPRVLELPYRFRARAAGESKLDALVLVEFLGLLLHKALGGAVPLRFLAFAAVGAVGLGVHLAVLSLAHGPLALGFDAAQWSATLAAMTANFLLNNRITYRDQRLRGPRLVRGLLLFYLVCGIGAAANVGIARLLLRDGILDWGVAGAAGALLTLVWNYAVSSTLVWRAR